VSNKILFVDDDASILAGFQRNLRGRFAVDVAPGGADGLVALSEHGPYAVVVADMRMPGMDGVRFLAQVRARAPETVRIMLTGNSDQHTAMEAVNEGRIFRFLTKPCPPEDLARALDAGLEQYRLVTAERELLEKTLSGSMKVLIEMLSLVNPAAFGRATRIRRYVRHMVRCLEVADRWEFEVAAMLSQIGCVTLPAETLEKVWAGEELSEDEARTYRNHPAAGARMLANIPRLERVAGMIADQQKGTGEHVSDPASTVNPVVLGAQMLRAAVGLDELLVAGGTLPDALQAMRSRPAEFNEALLHALQSLELADPGFEIRAVGLRDLQVCMVLDQDVRSRKGILLVARGQEVTVPVLQCLINYSRSVGVVEPLRVLVPHPRSGAQEDTGEGSLSHGA